jgi:hypothetical protein
MIREATVAWSEMDQSWGWLFDVGWRLQSREEDSDDGEEGWARDRRLRSVYDLSVSNIVYTLEKTLVVADLVALSFAVAAASLQTVLWIGPSI